MSLERTSVEQISISDVKPFNKKLKNYKKQVEQAKKGISYYKFYPPIIIDKNSNIVHGEHTYKALLELGHPEIAVIRVSHLSDTDIRKLRIFHESIALNADWNKENLSLEIQDLLIDCPVIELSDQIAMDVDQINIITDLTQAEAETEDIPELEDGEAITKLGDIFKLDDHLLLCGDALETKSHSKLMKDEKADTCSTDAPYNVPINGHVGNSGKIKHREFLQASGEMTDDGFTDFLTKAHTNIAAYTKDGAIIYSCMDWRHMKHMILASEASKLTLQNLCVWKKDNGGMGSLYRSQHELVFVFKNGTAPHTNNVQLGKNGRYRTNVWDYPGVNSFGSGRMNELKYHPTVKPVKMIEDALKDCSKRGEIVLDPFGGSGSTLIAAENCGRKARLIELDPHYCDVIIKRWQNHTCKDAVHAESKLTFNQIKKDLENEQR